MATVGRTPADALAQASGWGALAIYGNGMRLPGNPFFTFHDCSVFNAGYALIAPYGIAQAVPPPDVDWSSWNGEADLVTFLNAVDVNGGWTWSTGNPATNGYAQRVANPAEAVTGWWQCEVPGWMLPYISGRALEPNLDWLKYLPPIWPGLEFVQQYSTQYYTEPAAINIPCNGVIAEVGSMPAGTSTYDWGEIQQTPRAGYVSFITDGGQNEDPQPISFPSHIICPKLCRLASGLYVRPHAGGEVSITPWVYYSP